MTSKIRARHQLKEVTMTVKSA